jgi:hypothetical protein
MDDEQRTERERREAELPEHESDADVARQGGAGILGEGVTATDRGTGTLGGVAEPVDPAARDPRRQRDPYAEETGTFDVAIDPASDEDRTSR